MLQVVSKIPSDYHTGLYEQAMTLNLRQVQCCIIARRSIGTGIDDHGQFLVVVKYHP